MIRSIALGLLAAVATAGLGVLSAPAWAQEPTVEPARPAKPAKWPELGLWWNDPAIVEKLGLSSDQRAQMDRLFGTYESERKEAARSSNASKRFVEALEQGDRAQAQTELDSWVEGSGALVRAGGKLKIEVLALLSEEQRETLASAYPRLIRKAWVPRPSWEPRATPRGAAGGRPPKDPAE